MPLTHTGINKLQPSPTAIDTNDLINTVTVTGCNYGCVTRALSHGLAPTDGKENSKPSLLALIQ